MKKLIAICLALVLLCGCSPAPAQDPLQDTQVSANDKPGTALVSLYDADNPAEDVTNGAVRAYPLGDGSYSGLLTYGDKLLVVSDSGDITMLQGETCEIAATAATDLSSDWSRSDLYTGANGIAYYTTSSMEVVLLDDQLHVAARIPMPEDMQGKPVIQLDQGQIFYCTVGQIRVLDIPTGISRMIRSHESLSQELLGSFFDGSVIACMVVDASGEERMVYLNAETGEKLYENRVWGNLHTMQDRYFAKIPVINGVQTLFGQRDGQIMRLEVPQWETVPVLEMDGVVGYTADETGLQLAYFDLQSGVQHAGVSIPGVQAPTAVVSDGSFVWFLSGKTLYRWETDKSLNRGDAVLTSQMYTKEAPDTEGLAQCQSRADQLEQTYGFTLNIWQEAQTAAARFDAVGEYQTHAIHGAIDAMEEVLSKLPVDFLATTGDVRIHLVQGLPSGDTCAHYWENGAYNLVLAGTDIADWLLWGLGNAVDTRVLGNSFDYDTWEELNPWWFDYTYDYEENLERSNVDDLLEGDGRYFTDLVAMSYPTEDRSRLFANAMLSGNEEMFASSAMQKKLRCICIAIREAYDYQEHTEIFTWEQYLSKPIAPSK